ncbi:MAG TPA: DMT family transporter [Burkholderiaceae bacterium]|nr:DMT family transporter [Burkholderiaceae bacterium]
MPEHSRAVGIAAAVATIAIWTAFIVIARATALQSLSPWDILFCRTIGASLVLLPWGVSIVRRRRARAGAGATWLGVSPLSARLTVTCGLFGGIGYGVFAYGGFVHAPAAHGSVLLPGMLPLWTAVLSVAMLGERPSRLRIASLATILVGGALVGGGSLLRAFDGGDVWKGDLMFLAASASWSVYTVLMRRERLDPVEATIAITVFALMAYGSAYLLLAATGAIDARLASAPWGEILFQAAWQGIGSVVISGITFATMVRTFGPVRSTMLTALVPGLSATAAVIALGEPLGWNLVAGLALVTVGIVVGVRAASAR